MKLLVSQLSRCTGNEVLNGLLLVFSRSQLTESNYRKQELAGRLLAKLKPRVPIDLGSFLRSVLPAYDPSIEQLPQYLAEMCGRDEVIAELRQIELEVNDPRFHACARTMRWWLGDQAES